MRYAQFILPATWIALLLASCSPEGKLQPTDAKVSPSDWQAVSASAGSIKKEEVILEFPAGTFDDKDKVAITRFPAKAICGDDEKSPFYQFTMPKGGSAQPVTVSLRYAGDPSEVRAVMRTDYYTMSLEQFVKSVRIMESTADGGTISITIPETYAFEGESPVFTVGLVKADPGDDVGTRASNDLTQWTFGWNLTFKQWVQYGSARTKVDEFIRANVPYVQSILNARGFDIPKIYYEIQDLGDGKSKKKGEESKFIWGYSVTPKFLKTSGHIIMNVQGLVQVEGNGDTVPNVSIRKTLIHESLHALHTICYDPRWALKETFAGLAGDQWAMLSEAIAVWTEHFVDPNKRVSGPAAEEGNYLRFIRSFFPYEWWVGATNYANHGYGMAAFIQWLSKKTTPNAIVRLLELQKEGYSDVRKVFNKFLEEKHIQFFDKEHYLEFAKTYCEGELVPEVSFESMEYIINVKDSAPLSVSYFKSGGNVYSYGFAPARMKFAPTLMQAYSDENLTFSQLTPGLESHIWYVGSSGFVYAGKADSNSSLSLSINQFIKNSPGLVIATITVKSTMTDDYNYLKSSLLVSFEKPVSAPKIWSVGFAGDFVRDGYNYFINEGWTDGSGYSTITVTPVSNGYEVVALQDWYDVSFVITVKDGVFSDAVNIKNVSHLEGREAYNFTIDKLPLKGFDTGKDSSYGKARWNGSGSWYTGMDLEVYFNPL